MLVWVAIFLLLVFYIILSVRARKTHKSFKLVFTIFDKMRKAHNDEVEELIKTKERVDSTEEDIVSLQHQIDALNSD